jgi:hypothetical protein
MEKFRAFMDKVFWVVSILLVIAIVVLLFGGAIPININPSSQLIKFDLAHIGWEPNDPLTGTLEIVHDKKEVKEGWGAMRYSYKVRKGQLPGFHCTNFQVESILFLKFYVKAKKPGVWQIQLKRKTDGKIFHKTFRVGTEWFKYDVGAQEFKNETGYIGKFDTNDFQQWINIVDVNPRYDNNILWIDEFRMERM